MSAVSLTCTTNWLHSGCELANAIQTTVTHEDVFTIPELDELINEERAILLTSTPTNDNNTTITPACELEICIFPRYKIEAISVLCTSAKLEIFIGKQKEYLQTVYGHKITEDEVDENFKEPSLDSYRYDVELEKSGITEVMLKFLTTTNDLCIYGIRLNIAPNPNGITTLLPGQIDMGNIEQVLKTFDCKLSPNAEKCKHFMEKQAKCKEQTESQIVQNAVVELDSNLKLFIDEKFKELENKINLRLNDISAKHFEKLDAILQLLNNK